MYNSKDILDELNSLSPALVPLKNVNVFTVPVNYFEDLGDKIIEEIKAGGITVLSGEAINTMDVPAGYFDNLAENILAKIKAAGVQTSAEELKELSPALTATGNDNVYSVPRGYFEDLPEIILSRLGTAKVVSMRPRRSIIRYAAAAVVTGILGLSLFTAFNQKSAVQESNTVLTASVIEEANKIIKTNSFDKTLESVSDDEIVSYLENKGQDVEAALVAASTDTKDLPSQDEYIINENTLDNYLKELNINDYTN